MQIYGNISKDENGVEHRLCFVRLKDMPKDFVDLRIPEDKLMIESFEIIWDIEKKEFKYFNWNKMKEQVEKLDFVVDMSELL